MTMRISNKSVMQFPLSAPGASKRWPAGCKNGPGSLQIIYKVRLQTDKLSCTTVPFQNSFRLLRRSVGVLDENLLWGAAAPSSPVLPQLQRRGPLLHGLVWLRILACARLFQVTWWEPRLPFAPSHSTLLDRSLCCAHGTPGACSGPCR